jgi:type VI secretion system protein ImpK
MNVNPNAGLPTQPPSLFGNTVPAMPVPQRAHAALEASCLLDLMYDGFYMLFLLRNQQAPAEAEGFREKVREFLVEFERGSSKLGAASEDVYLSKYAFCALVDEVVLQSQFSVRDAWERQPLQLQFFGEQLAGENFFARLEDLRRQGAARLQVLEVFHMCLLLGFKGKYLIEGIEKLNYLTARLGDEIAQWRGRHAELSPHWAAPDRIAHTLRHEVPLWAIASVFALLALGAFIGLNWHLSRGTQQDLAAYQDVIKMPPKVANVTITLP